MTNFNESIRTVFTVYCIYALYCCLVVFNRPNNPSDTLAHFRIPVVVVIYFLVPCVALYLTYRAFWQIHGELFWTGICMVLPLSFFIMLYILTDPEWPVGKFLQLQRLPITLVFILLSLNVAFSVVVAGVSSIAIYNRPVTIENSSRAAEYKSTTENLQKLQGEESAHETQLRAIQSEATTTIFAKYGDLLKVLLPLITALLTFATSMIALRKK